MARRRKTRSTFSFDKKEFDKIMPKIIKELKDKNSIIRPIMTKAKEEILDNAERRFMNHFKGVGSRQGVDVLQAMRNSSNVVVTDKSVTINIAKKDQMDIATKLPPTKSEGKVYSLWSLLREGWGREGGKRPDDYILMVYTNSGIFPPYPEEVNRIKTEGTHIGPGDRYMTRSGFKMFIRHPGSKGFDWLTVTGRPHQEDLNSFNKGLNRAARIIGDSYTKRRFLRVAR